MRRAMKAQNESEYILQHYNRHMKMNPQQDYTMELAVYDILEWMKDKDEFKEVIFDPKIDDRECLNKLMSNEEKNKLIQSIFKDKIHHRKKTIEIALTKFLLNDLYYEDQYDFLVYIQ